MVILTVENSTYNSVSLVRLLKTPSDIFLILLLFSRLDNNSEHSHSSYSFQHPHGAVANVQLSHSSLSIPISTEGKNWHSRAIHDVLLVNKFETLTTCKELMKIEITNDMLHPIILV